MRRFSYLLLLLFLVSACTSTPIKDRAYQPLPQLTFAHLVQIPVNIQKMRVTAETMRGAQPWDIANDLPTPPDVAMVRYLERRYKPIGGNGTLLISLAKATVDVREVANDIKFLSYFDVANMNEFTYEIIVDLETQYMTGMPNRRTSLRFVRSVTMPMKESLSYREARLQRTLEELIRDIDEGVTRTLSNEFGLIAKNDIPISSMDIRTAEPVLEPLPKRLVPLEN
jgi:hypothetical protein